MTVILLRKPTDTEIIARGIFPFIEHDAEAYLNGVLRASCRRLMAIMVRDFPEAMESLPFISPYEIEDILKYKKLNTNWELFRSDLMELYAAKLINNDTLNFGVALFAMDKEGHRQFTRLMFMLQCFVFLEEGTHTVLDEKISFDYQSPAWQMAKDLLINIMMHFFENPEAMNAPTEGIL